MVSFSGGVDSSALLALATRLARREGLPAPVPATLVFPGVGAADEEAWQLRVLGATGVDQALWLRLEIGEELGLLGPVARAVLARHGLVWPFNLHMHQPIIDAASGGTVVTGFGGDELARSSAVLWAERLIAKRRLRRPRHLAVAALGVGPPGLRFARELFRPRVSSLHAPWLTARGKVLGRLAEAEEATLPFGWGRVLREWLWTRRFLQICRRNFEALGDESDVRIVHPFVAPRVLSALGTGPRYRGVGGRPTLIRWLFGGALPEDVASRTTKASFDDPLWTPETFRFAARWSGRGLDGGLVRPDALRAHWLSGEPSAMSASLVQAAWLADGAPEPR